MGIRRLLEACQVLEKAALKHSSKSSKYELESSYDELANELSWTCHTPLFWGLMCGKYVGNIRHMYRKHIRKYRV